MSGGEIQWRLHEDCENVVLMNNYNHTTSHMMPENFVHVTCTTGSNNDIYLSCTCPIYNLIQRAEHNETSLSPRRRTNTKSQTDLHALLILQPTSSTYVEVCLTLKQKSAIHSSI